MVRTRDRRPGLVATGWKAYDSEDLRKALVSSGLISERKLPVGTSRAKILRSVRKHVGQIPGKGKIPSFPMDHGLVPMVPRSQAQRMASPIEGGGAMEHDGVYERPGVPGGRNSEDSDSDYGERNVSEEETRQTYVPFRTRPLVRTRRKDRRTTLRLRRRLRDREPRMSRELLGQVVETAVEAALRTRAVASASNKEPARDSRGPSEVSEPLGFSDQSSAGPRFDRVNGRLPEWDSENMERSFRHLEVALRLQGVPEAEWLKHLATVLTGDSLQPFLELAEDHRRTYREAKMYMLEQAGWDESQHQLAFEGLSFDSEVGYRRFGQSLEYHLRNWLGPPSEQAYGRLLVSRFLKSIPSEVGAVVHRLKPTTLEEAISMATRESLRKSAWSGTGPGKNSRVANNFSIRQNEGKGAPTAGKGPGKGRKPWRKRNRPSFPSQGNNSQQTQQTQQERKPLVLAPPAPAANRPPLPGPSSGANIGQRKPGHCFRCLEPGHYARDCPTVGCTVIPPAADVVNAGGVGWTAVVEESEGCVERKNGETLPCASAHSSAAPVPETSSRFYGWCCLNGQPARVLLDTGAALTLVNEKLVVDVKQEGSLRIRGINGDISSCVTKKVDICLDGHSYEVVAACLNTRVIGPDVLVGRDILEGNNIRSISSLWWVRKDIVGRFTDTGKAALDWPQAAERPPAEIPAPVEVRRKRQRKVNKRERVGKQPQVSFVANDKPGNLVNVGHVERL